jgi:glycosyltransferase involved in cell wall biosynthesis
MLEYGYDLEHSKALVSELGIDKHVIWLPKMYRKEIMQLISRVDVCTGEYGRSYLTFGTIIEAMLLKKPVIHYRDDNLYTGIYPELYPLLNAREPEEIEIAIGYALNNPGELKKMGEAASGWVKKYFIEKPLKTLQNLIEASN